MKPHQNISILLNSALALADQFAEKHEYDSELVAEDNDICSAIGWYEFGDHVVSLETIIIDMHYDVSPDVFVQYSDHQTEEAMAGRVPYSYINWLKRHKPDELKNPS